MNTINTPFRPFKIYEGKTPVVSPQREGSSYLATLAPNITADIKYDSRLSLSNFQFECSSIKELDFKESFGAPVIKPTLQDIFEKVRLIVRRRIRQKLIRTTNPFTSSIYCESIEIDTNLNIIKVRLGVNYLR